MDTPTRLKYKGNEQYYSERNQKLIADRDSGMTWRALGNKYGLCDNRLRVIYRKYSRKFTMKGKSNG